MISPAIIFSAPVGGSPPVDTNYMVDGDDDDMVDGDGNNMVYE